MPFTTISTKNSTEWKQDSTTMISPNQLVNIFLFHSNRELLPPATKLVQGNIFRSVCQDFCLGGRAWQGEGMHGRGACVAGACMAGGCTDFPLTLAC